MDNSSNSDYQKYVIKGYSANVFKVGEHDFILDKRYHPTAQCNFENCSSSKSVGAGAYGVVLMVDDTKAAEGQPKKIAMKKIEKCF
jgi:mitogen-activated protein kinase 1/3